MDRRGSSMVFGSISLDSLSGIPGHAFWVYGNRYTSTPRLKRNGRISTGSSLRVVIAMPRSKRKARPIRWRSSLLKSGSEHLSGSPSLPALRNGLISRRIDPLGVDEIIEEIKQLPARDQLAVADFVMEITGRATPLSGIPAEARDGLAGKARSAGDRSGE